MSRTEFSKSALAIEVGRYMLIGFPSKWPAGFEKSRADWRKESGSVCVGTGAAGNGDAAPLVVSIGACCENPDGKPAVRVSTTAATARNLPAPLRRLAGLRSLRLVSCSSKYTPWLFKYIFPLHELL